MKYKIQIETNGMFSLEHTDTHTQTSTMSSMSVKDKAPTDFTGQKNGITQFGYG